MIKRSDFVRYLVQYADLTYVKAEQVYAATMRLLEDSIAAKSTVNLGRVGALVPVQLKPRRVMMHFKRSGGKNGGSMQRCKSEFFLGVRTRFIFKMHKSFGKNHGIVP